jgi:hypothetical protein
MSFRQHIAGLVPPTAKYLGRLLRQGAAAGRYVESFRTNGAAGPATAGASGAPERSPNPLEQYFDAHREGPGIWKWRHYFDIYHRHLAGFVGRPVNVLEVGIYSGGSLGMWRNYFGPGATIFGVDIEPACKSYETDGVRVFIGDQADREFWKGFRREVPALDVVIDDGGHETHQQVATLEALLPHLRPGGVFICEDVHGITNGFASYAAGLAQNLHAFDVGGEPANPERRVFARTSPFQSAVHSIHIYPYVVVIERTDAPVAELVAPKHGTQWQPFLK